MTTAPFRDLFVELPRAVFDALHAWGEAVIVKARASKQPIAPAWRPIVDPALLRLLSLRAGWKQDFEITRVAYDAAIEIAGTRYCGHRQRYRIDERRLIMARGLPEQYDLLLDAVDSTPRDCYCVQRKS